MKATRHLPQQRRSAVRRISATPSASSIDDQQFVSPPPSPLRAQPYQQQRRSPTNRTNKPTATTAMYKYSINPSTESDQPHSREHGPEERAQTAPAIGRKPIAFPRVSRAVASAAAKRVVFGASRSSFRPTGAHSKAEGRGREASLRPSQAIRLLPSSNFVAHHALQSLQPRLKGVVFSL